MNNSTLNESLFQSLPLYQSSKGKTEKMSRSCPNCHSGKLAFGRRGEYFVNICGCDYKDIYKAGRKFLGGDFDTTEYKEKQEQKRQEQALIRAEKLQGKLTPDQLNKAIRTISSEYGLRKKHQEKLIERGFSLDQIKEKLFFSISKGENDIPPGVPYNFPGVNQRGKLYSGYSGIACVFIDSQGRAASWQVRDDDPDSDNKYTWLYDSKVKVSDSESELPINVFLPPLGSEIREDLNQKIQSLLPPADNRKIAIFTEGGPIKGNIPGYRYNIPVFSAAGGYFSSSPTLTEQAIKQSGINYVLIAIDGGDICNDHRRLHWKNQVKFLKSLGVSVSCIWYQQWEKAGLDIDEISPDQLLEKLELLTLDQWLDLDYVGWKLGEIRKTYRELTGAKIINPDQQYLDLSEQYDAIASARLICLSAPMGSGKTEQILKLARKNFTADRLPFIFNLTYLNSLSRGLQGRSNDIIKHLQDYDNIPSDCNLSFCHQSLPKFSGRRNQLSGRRIFIDEVVSVLENILTGSNVQNRFLIFELFRFMLGEAEKVFISDANLSNTEIAYIAEIMGIDNDDILIYKKPSIDNNKFNIVIRDTWYLDPNGSGTNSGKDSEGKLLNEVLLLSKEDKKIVITSESQNDLEAIHNKALETNPNLKIIRIDSTTVRNADPAIKSLTENFLKYPDKTIEQEKPDLLLISPLCNSGTDISIENYFFRQYHIGRGVLNTNATAQLLGRVRDLAVEKHIFFLRPDIKGYFPNIDGIFYNEARAEVLRSEELKARISSSLSCFSDSEEDILEHQKNIENKTQSLLTQYIQEFKLARKIDYLSQYERQNQRKLLIEYLQDKGHNIVQKEDLIAKMTDKAFKKEKELIKEKNAEYIYNAGYIPIETEVDQLPNYDQVEFINLEERTLEKPDGVGILNHSYRKRLPGIEQSESWTKDLLYTLHYGDKTLIERLSLYHLLQNPDIASNLKTSKTISYLNNSPDFLEIYDKYSPKIDVLRYLGIDKLLSRTVPYTGNDEQIKDICNKYKNKKNSLSGKARELLGVNPDNITSNCQLVAAILGKIQVGTRGKKLEKEVKGKIITWTEYSIILPGTPRYKKLTVKQKKEGVQPELIPSPIPDLLSAIAIKFDRYSPEKFNIDISQQEQQTAAPISPPAPLVAPEKEKVGVAIAPAIKPSIDDQKKILKVGDFVKFADGWDDIKYQILSISQKGVAKIKNVYGQICLPTINVLVPYS